MDEKSKLGLGILCAALLVGICGDSLLRATPWGLNLVMWVGLLIMAGLLAARWRQVAFLSNGRWALLPAIFFAGTFAWHDSATLGVANFLALLAALAILALRSRAGKLQTAGVVEYVGGSMFVATFSSVGVVPLTFSDIRWKEIPHGGMAGNAAAIARGLFVAVPLLLVFGGLFMAADAAFEGLVRSLFHWNLPEALGHTFLATAFAWVAAGFLRVQLIGPDWQRTKFDCPRSFSLGIIEMGTVLGVLNALFLMFVIVLFPYLFGGTQYIDATNISYSDYARRGFFELVAVAVLLLPVLLAADWSMRRGNLRHMQVFRVLTTTLVILLFVIIASAFQRMFLYYEQFGLTELRLYTMVFMAWMAIVFIWFLTTVQRGARERFAFGVVITGFAALAALNLVNPEAVIVRENVQRAISEQPMDARNVAKLSADAVPPVIESLSKIHPSDRRLITENLLWRWSKKEADWRTWNWSREQAAQAVDANQGLLQELLAAQ